jgi:hypothetical protein
MRLCFGAFGRVLKCCKVKANSQNKLVSVILRSVDKNCNIEDGPSSDNAVNFLLNCRVGLSNGKKKQSAVANHSGTKTGDPFGRIVSEAQKSDPKTVAIYFKDNVLPLLDPNMIKLAILALREIIKKDEALDSDTIIDVIGNKKRDHILSQSEFVASDFFASIFLYTAVSVYNKLGEDAVADITKEFVESFESQRDSIRLVQNISDNNDEEFSAQNDENPHNIFQTNGIAFQQFGANSTQIARVDTLIIDND